MILSLSYKKISKIYAFMLSHLKNLSFWIEPMCRLTKKLSSKHLGVNFLEIVYFLLFLLLKMDNSAHILAWINAQTKVLRVSSSYKSIRLAWERGFIVRILIDADPFFTPLSKIRNPSL